MTKAIFYIKSLPQTVLVLRQKSLLCNVVENRHWLQNLVHNLSNTKVKKALFLWCLEVQLNQYDYSLRYIDGLSNKPIVDLMPP